MKILSFPINENIYSFRVMENCKKKIEILNSFEFLEFSFNYQI